MPPSRLVPDQLTELILKVGSCFMLEFMASSNRRVPSVGTSSCLFQPECGAPGSQACCLYRPSKSCAAMPDVILQQAAGSPFV